MKEPGSCEHYSLSDEFHDKYTRLKRPDVSLTEDLKKHGLHPVYFREIYSHLWEFRWCLEHQAWHVWRVNDGEMLEDNDLQHRTESSRSTQTYDET